MIFTFDVYFKVRVKWFDKNLRFKYLKTNADENILTAVEKTQIWVPKIDFSLVRNSFRDHNEKIYVEKTRPKIMEVNLVNAPEIYDGSETPIFYHSEHHMRFYCGFEGIDLYPFETETCFFDFYFNGPANTLTEVNSNLLVTTKNALKDYEIIGWEENHNPMCSTCIWLSHPYLEVP